MGGWVSFFPAGHVVIDGVCFRGKPLGNVPRDAGLNGVVFGDFDVDPGDSGGNGCLVLPCIVGEPNGADAGAMGDVGNVGNSCAIIPRSRRENPSTDTCLDGGVGCHSSACGK